MHQTECARFPCITLIIHIHMTDFRKADLMCELLKALWEGELNANISMPQ